MCFEAFSRRERIPKQVFGINIDTGNQFDHEPPLKALKAVLLLRPNWTKLVSNMQLNKNLTKVASQ